MVTSTDPCSYARGPRLCIDVLGLPGEMSGQDYTDYWTALQGWFLCIYVLGLPGETIGSSTWSFGRQRFASVNLCVDRRQWRVPNRGISGCEPHKQRLHKLHDGVWDYPKAEVDSDFLSLIRVRVRVGIGVRVRGCW